MVVSIATAVMVSPTRAECVFTEPWEPFANVAPIAEFLVVGKVIEDRTPDHQGGRLGRFGLLVQAVYRGDATVGSVIDIRYVPPHSGELVCTTYLRPMLGDVLAIAIGAAGSDGRTYNSAAWLSGAPDANQQGLGTITASDLEALVGLPPTDVGPMNPDNRSGVAPLFGALVTMIAALLGALVVLRKRGVG